MPHLRCAVLFALLVASACDKPNDLPRMQDELVASAQDYRARFDELKRRADAIEPRTHALPQDTSTAPALHALGVARTKIDQRLNGLQQVQTMLPVWLGSEDVRDLLRAWLDKRPELEADVVDATSEIEAVESWTAVAEQRAGAPQSPAAAPPPEPAPPTSDDRAPQTDASGAPIR